MTRGGQAHKIKEYHPSPLNNYLVESYWDLKCGDLDYRIRPSDTKDTLLDRNERGIILAMDKAFIGALATERSKAMKEKAKRK